MQNKFIFVCFLFFTSMASAKTNKWRLLITSDPSHSMTLGWNQQSGKEPVLYMDDKDYGSDYKKYRYSIKPELSVDYKGMNNCYVRMRQLYPDTKYYFLLRDSDGNSKRYWFKTLPEANDSKVSIIAGGDSRNHRDARRNANLLVAKLRVDLVLFGGDMTFLGTNVQWEEWFEDWELAVSDDGYMTPLATCRGNHESSNEPLQKLFDVPSPDVYYAFNIGGSLARVYTLNSLIAVGGEQAKWLEKDLSENKNSIWRITQYHYPIRPHVARKKERNEERTHWAKLFYKYKMQLAVECDAHVVKYTYPISPSDDKKSDEGFITDFERGTTYIGEGCWGAPLRKVDDNKNWTRGSGSFNQIHWIFISKEKIEIRTVKTDNAKQVSALSEDKKFNMPEKIKLWNLKEIGAVLTIWQK